jgi:hypothetical protein
LFNIFFKTQLSLHLHSIFLEEEDDTAMAVVETLQEEVEETLTNHQIINLQIMHITLGQTSRLQIIKPQQSL